MLESAQHATDTREREETWIGKMSIRFSTNGAKLLSAQLRVLSEPPLSTGSYCLAYYAYFQDYVMANGSGSHKQYLFTSLSVKARQQRASIINVHMRISRAECWS